jgi:hypothetical protein
MARKGPWEPVENRMAKRTPSTPHSPGAAQKPSRRQQRPGIVHSSVYLPEPIYEALREAAFKERCKIHDIVLEGIETALRKRGYKATAQ